MVGTLRKLFCMHQDDSFGCQQQWRTSLIIDKGLVIESGRLLSPLAGHGSCRGMGPGTIVPLRYAVLPQIVCEFLGNGSMCIGFVYLHGVGDVINKSANGSKGHPPNAVVLVLERCL